MIKIYNTNSLLTIPTIILFILATEGKKWVKIFSLRQNNYLNIGKTRMSNILLLLEKRKLIERKRLGNHVFVRITDAGNHFISEHPQKISSNFEEFIYFLERLGLKSNTSNFFLTVFNRKKIDDFQAYLITRTGKKGIIFNTLNNDPNLKNIDLSILFPHISKSTISKYHKEWIEIEKQIFNLKLKEVKNNF